MEFGIRRRVCFFMPRAQRDLENFPVSIVDLSIVQFS